MSVRKVSIGSMFLEELKDMRQRWRLKRIGNLILGDLGYAPNGVRYRSGATFEVRSRAVGKGSGASPAGSCLQVSIPRQLRLSYQLRVYIVFDDGTAAEKPNSSAVGEKDPKGPSHWEEQLSLAQATLVNRDIFQQLGKEAVGLEERICMVEGDWLAVSLGHGFLLKVALVLNDSPDPKGWVRAPLLEVNLRRLHATALKEAMPVLGRPASLPLHQGRPPALPVTRKRRLNAGPRAIPVEEGEESLLGRLVQMAEHYLLVRRTLALLSQFKAACTDPALLWSWVDAGPTFSILRVHIATPNSEYYPRMNMSRSAFFLELGPRVVKVISGSGEAVRLAPDLGNLHDMLWIQCRSHQLLELRATGGNCDWRCLYSTSASVSLHATLLPTLLLANTAGTKALCVRLPLRAEPEFFLQTSLRNGARSRLEGLIEGEDWRHLRGDFQQLAYHRLRGANLPNKLEILLAALNASQ